MSDHSTVTWHGQTYTFKTVTAEDEQRRIDELVQRIQDGGVLVWTYPTIPDPNISQTDLDELGL